MDFKVAHGTAGGRVADCHHMARSHSALNRPPHFCSRHRAANKKAALWAAVLLAERAGLCLFRLRPAQPSAARTALCASSEPCSLVEPAGSPPRPAAPNKKATSRVAVLFGGEGGIRTRVGMLSQTRFPGVRLKPLIHLSGKRRDSSRNPGAAAIRCGFPAGCRGDRVESAKWQAAAVTAALFRLLDSGQCPQSAEVYKFTWANGGESHHGTGRVSAARVGGDRAGTG